MNKLLESIKHSISETLKERKIGIAFSGGVDSALISKICSEMKYDITLLTIGFAKSHDIIFAKEVNQYLRYPHHILEIDSATFRAVSSAIHHTIKTDNLSWNENCIAFYYVSKLAQSLGLYTVVTANGIDELFCGYDVYRREFSKGQSHIYNIINEKLENEQSMMQSVNLVASEFGVEICQPLLNSEFIKYAKTIPLCEKIHSSDDMYRKHIVRQLARDLKVPEISCAKRKKALQYGSQIHKKLTAL